MGSQNFPEEILALTKADSFLIFDHITDNFSCQVHYHAEYEINFILNGRGLKRIIGSSAEVTDDIELVLIGPNVPHGWELNNCRTKTHCITIQFPAALLDGPLFSKKKFLPVKEMLGMAAHGVVFSKKTAEKLSARFMKISKTEGVNLFADVVSIMVHMANSKGRRILENDKKIFTPDKKMLSIQHYMKESFTGKITLEEVSAKAGMSVASFNRFIKKNTGKTFINYLNEIRIGYAARNIIETDLSIARIAENSGFNNIANFNRIFKKVTNMTPGKYREAFYGKKRFV